MEETDDELVNTVLETYMAVTRGLLRSVAPQWLQLDLTMAQMRVLFVLMHKGPSSIGTLAEALRIGLPTASHLVERLVRVGLVARTENPKDRRYTLARLTSWGEELMERLHQTHLDQLRGWLLLLNQEELTALHRGLQGLARVSHASQPCCEQQRD
ncbi:MAG: winged helix-turn-helix transcriptional regulator [Ktedonobacteraceae bacterium]|nr:winged helix-turn-helix transcriptional regulator [Ktedonobacteraceae bacterium]